MNFTREPIIETVISPKEGYKLIVRNSKGTGQEEYVVDAIEVVSFGKSLFFRSTEKPKAFLVPVSDYEVVEAKETRVVLKNASFDRAIKIGGGREAPVKAAKEKAPEEEPVVVETKPDKKRERRRRRRRSTPLSEEVKESAEEVNAEPAPKEEAPPVKVLPTVTRLIPPPALLIADKILKEKKAEEPPVLAAEEPPVEDKLKGRKKKEEEETPSEPTEGSELQRLSSAPVEEATSTSFVRLEEKKKFSFFEKIW